MAWMLFFAVGAASLWFTPQLLFAPAAEQGMLMAGAHASLSISLSIFLALALALACLAAQAPARRAIGCATALLLGLVYAHWQAAQSLSQMLPAAHDRDEFLVEGVVRGIVTRAPLQKYDGSSAVVQRFDFQLTALRRMPDADAGQTALDNVGPFAIPALKPVRDGSGQPRRLRLSSYADEPLAAGQSWRLLVRLRSPRGLANPGSFDPVRFMLANHIDAYGYVREKFIPTRLAQAKSIGLSAQLAMRLQALRADRYRVLQPLLQRLQHPGIYNALLLGEKSTLPAPQKLLLQRTGTAHLLAISGLHIGLAAGLGMLLGRAVLLLCPQLGVHFPAPHWLALCSLPLAFFYAVLAGLALPTQRALIMLLSYACASLWLRHVHPFNHLLIALTIVLLLDPLAVLASGMWLSFAAVGLLIRCFAGYRHTASLAVQLPFKSTVNLPAKLFEKLFEKLAAKLPAVFPAKLPAKIPAKIPTSTAQAIAPRAFVFSPGRKLHAAVRAQLAIFFGMPLVLAGFGLPMPVVAPLANLIVVPIVGLWVVPAGIMALLLSYLSMDAALALLRFADLGLYIVLNALEFLAGLSALQLGTATLSRWLYAAASVAAIAVLLGRRRAPLYGLATLAWLLLFNPFDAQLASARRIANSALQDGDFVLTQFDVGQGSAVLISTRQQHWLYDTGGKFGSSGDAGRAVILPALRRFGIAALDGAIVSHGDKDHAGGARSLAAGIPVGEWFLGGSASDDLVGPDAALRSCTAGWQAVVDGVVFEFMHPPGAGGQAYKENDRSCVLKLSSLNAPPGSGNALLPGDISRAVERQLLQQFGTEKGRDFGEHVGAAVHTGVAVDVLVVPHHGSKTSSSAVFLDALRPRYALVSAGFNNRYRHPHPEVVRRYVNREIRVLRSDELGAIQLAYSGGRWQPPRCARYRGRFFWQRWDNTQRCAGTLHNP